MSGQRVPIVCYCLYTLSRCFLILQIACHRSVVDGTFVQRQSRLLDLPWMVWHICQPAARTTAASTTDLRLSKTTTPTRYTIQAKPTDLHSLNVIVSKHARTLDQYLQAKPLSAHTVRAFDKLQWQLGTVDGAVSNRNLILDSGCGTGQSSLLLGKLHPDSVVIGVDRSAVRLSKNRLPTFLSELDQQEQLPSTRRNDYNHLTGEESVQQVASNVFLVRADLVDFWRCILREQQQQHTPQQRRPELDGSHAPLPGTKPGATTSSSSSLSCWTRIEHHYMLYPNPYPKRSRLQQRWYAHASFPLLWMMRPSVVTIRSNWQQYLIECSQSLQIMQQLKTTTTATVTTTKQATLYDAPISGPDLDMVSDLYANRAMMYSRSYDIVHGGPVLRAPQSMAWTLFEQKYWAAGEPTYEISFERRLVPEP